MSSTMVSAQAGIRPVASDCIAAIERDGYCYVPQVFTPEQVSKALDLVRSWFDSTVASQSERMPILNRDQPMVYNLQSKELFFIRMVLGSELIESILLHFLNDRWFTSIPPTAPNYILRSFLARRSPVRSPWAFSAAGSAPRR